VRSNPLEKVKLAETTGLEIISLVDNTVDFLSSNTRKEVHSFQHSAHWHKGLPHAENGLSMLIRVQCDSETTSILFDAGTSQDGVCENAKLMDIDLGEVGTVVLSHGHYDHFGGLAEVVRSINNPFLQVITHEDMVKPRAVANSKGELRKYPTFPEQKNLTPAEIVDTKQPFLIASGFGCVTGEIPRTVEFETGMVNNRILREGDWIADPLLMDERALVFNLKGKGLVVVSGCAHAGIINTVHYAQQITGVEKVYAVFGGFHLSGREFEKRIPQTVAELQKIGPDLVVPSHCTGWRALYALNGAFPNGFIFNSVGNHYTLE
jgi:7,8-dihydropterin-6-yl-methyl-4-(beta-D-ribofuranosyl)aminobenzene 5'-phosphate synthase